MSAFDPYQETISDLDLDINSQKIKDLIKKLLTTEDGLCLLAILEKNILLTPSFNLGETPEYGYYREGQKDLVRQFITILTENKQKISYLTSARQALKNMIHGKK